MSAAARKKIWVTLELAAQLDALRGSRSYDTCIRELIGADASPRARWPFDSMMVGESVSYNASFLAQHHRALGEALRRVAAKGKSFTKNLDDGQLTITRFR